MTYLYWLGEVIQFWHVSNSSQCILHNGCNGVRYRFAMVAGKVVVVNDDVMMLGQVREERYGSCVLKMCRTTIREHCDPTHPIENTYK